MLTKRGFVPLIEQLPWKDAGNVLFVRQAKKKKISAIINALGGFQ